MIYIPLIIVLTFPLAILAQNGSHNLQKGECVTNYDAEVDYFPSKLEVQYPEHFTVEYFNSYKVVNNLIAGEKLVLYQCGTPEPTVANATAVVAIPVSNVAVLSTTYIAFIEQLGERGSIAAISGAGVISSPCVQRRLEEGMTVDAASSSGWGVDNTVLESIDVDVSFTSYASGELNAISVNEYSEKDPFAIYEWLEFFALFYNKEAEAANLVTESEDLWNCHERLVSGNDAVDVSVTPGRKPKVLWAYKYPEAWGGMWAGASCPNYNCEMIKDAGGEIIDYDWGLGVDEATFLSVAQEADVWLYASDNWSTLTGDFVSVPAFANGEVYDFLGASGPSDWLESRLAQPDVVLEDFITILYPGLHLGHQRRWWRNVFSEGETSALSANSCRDISEPFVLKSDGCYVPASTQDSDATEIILVIVLCVTIILSCGMGMYFAKKSDEPTPVKGLNNAMELTITGTGRV